MESRGTCLAGCNLKEFWNENELNALLKDFRTGTLSAPEPKIDQAAELQKKWKTRRGQISQIGRHRLMLIPMACVTKRLPGFGWRI